MVRFFGLQVWVYFYVSWTPLESADVTMSGVTSSSACLISRLGDHGLKPK